MQVRMDEGWHALPKAHSRAIGKKLNLPNRSIMHHCMMLFSMLGD
jgi:hypothetical protein